jgi:hypothetical protein
MMNATQCCWDDRRHSRRHANVRKMRQRMRCVIILCCFVQSLCAVALSQQSPANAVSATSITFVQLRSIPELCWLSFYIFIVCFLLQTCRLISGSGDDLTTFKVRHLEVSLNVAALLGYIICSSISGATDHSDSWKWLSYFLGVLSVLVGLAVLVLSKWLISLLHMVPDVDTDKRETLIGKIRFIGVICAVFMVLRGAYGIVLATAVLGNTGPYPVAGSSVNAVVVDLSTGCPMAFTLMLSAILLYGTTMKRREEMQPLLH